MAQRTDNSALVALELSNNELFEMAQKKWPHIDYANVFNDIEEINRTTKFNRIGYDRTGVGDGLKHLMKPFSTFLPIVTSNNVKVQIINLVNGLFQDGKLHLLRGTELEKEMSEQQFTTTDAGNIQYRHPSGRHDDLFWALGYACYISSPYMKGTIRSIMRSNKNDFRDNLEDRIDKDMEDLINADI